jgi:hypothetical protein
MREFLIRRGIRRITRAEPLAWERDNLAARALGWPYGGYGYQYQSPPRSVPVERLFRASSVLQPGAYADPAGQPCGEHHGPQQGDAGEDRYL